MMLDEGITGVLQLYLAKIADIFLIHKFSHRSCFYFSLFKVKSHKQINLRKKV